MIAKGLTGQAAAVLAGRRSIALRSKMFRADSTFGLETTLSGRTLNRFFRESQDADYRIVIVYMWLDNPQLCIERISVRVAAGGHPVPDEDVTRRFFRSNVNFWTRDRLIADQWFLFYNGHKKPKLVASGTKDFYDVSSRQLLERYRGLIDECKNQLDSKRNK